MTDTEMTAATQNNLPSDLNQLTVELKFYINQWGQNTIEIGKRLIAAKELVGQGNWLNWLEKNFNLTIRTADRFMKCAERFGNWTSMSNLNSTQMIQLLVLSREETKKFIAEKAAENNPVEDMTVKELREEIKDWKAQLEQKNSEVTDLFAENERLKEDKSKLAQCVKDSTDNVIKMRGEVDKLTAEKNQLEQDNAVLTKQRDDAAEDSAKYQAKNSELELQLQNQTEKIIEKVVEPADYKPLQNQLAEKQAQIAKLEQELATKDTTIEIQQTAELEQAKKDYAALEEKFKETAKRAEIFQLKISQGIFRLQSGEELRY